MSLSLAMYFTAEQLFRVAQSPSRHCMEPLNIRQCDAIATQCASPSAETLLAEVANRCGKKGLIRPLTVHTGTLPEAAVEDWKLFGTEASQPQMIDASQLQSFADWHADTLPQWLIVPAPLFAVAKGLVNIYKLDPYLARHYLRQLHPLLAVLTPHDIDTLLWAKMDPSSHHLSANQHRFCQFEKKIVRQYDAH